MTLSGNAGGVTLGRNVNVAGTFLNNGGYIQSAGIAVLHNLDGAGDTTVSAGATLTADHIRQDSLTLAGAATIRTSGAQKPPARSIPSPSPPLPSST